MNRIFGLVIPILIIGCAGTGSVELGFNDEGLLRGTGPELAIWVSKIEFPEEGTYTTVWEGSKRVQVPTGSREFLSITDGYIEITPGSYQTIRLTVDSLHYITDATSNPLVDTTCQFIATAFIEIVIEDGDEMQLVVDIMSSNWFDADSLTNTPFEGARLKIYVDY